MNYTPSIDYILRLSGVLCNETKFRINHTIYPNDSKPWYTIEFIYNYDIVCFHVNRLTANQFKPNTLLLTQSNSFDLVRRNNMLYLRVSTMMPGAYTIIDTPNITHEFSLTQC